MLSQKNSFLLIFWAILLLNSSLLSFISDDLTQNINRHLPVKADDESSQAAYNLNTPFSAGSLFSDRVDPVIICQDKRFKKIISGSFLNLDDRVIQFIIQHNSDIFRTLQLRTTFEFSCILQI